MATVKQAQHTPGPWRYAPTHDARRVAFAGNSSHGPVGWLEQPHTNTKEENEANARLIAAAPELLAACKAALERFGPGETDSPLQAKLRAAIAKAKGG